MNVPLVWAVLDSGAARRRVLLEPSLWQLWQAEKQHHLRGVGEQVITSFIKLQVLGARRRQDVHHAPSITDGSTPPFVGNDHLLPRCSSIHLCLGDCWLKIPSRRIKAKMTVTTSNHVMVNMADFLDGLGIGNVLAVKRSHEDDDTSGDDGHGTSGTKASTEIDADVVREKR